MRNVSNQNWAVAVDDELNRENGIPLFDQDDPATPRGDEGDGWISRSMPSWNADGTAVTFWESGNGDEHGIAPTHSRLVIANLKYTTSVGPVGDTTTVFDPSAFPDLSTYVAKTTPLPPTGTLQRRGRWHRGGQRGHRPDDLPYDPHGAVHRLRQRGRNDPQRHRIGDLRAVPTQRDVPRRCRCHGCHRSQPGQLDANAVVTLLPTQSVTGFITSTFDGDTQTIPDPAKVEDAKTGA